MKGLIVPSNQSGYYPSRHQDSGNTKEQIRDQFAVEGHLTTIKRLTKEREYHEGRSPADIISKFGWDEQTIYGWLNRFVPHKFEALLYDDKTSGLPLDNNDEQFQVFAETLHPHPEDGDYDAPAWSSHGNPSCLEGACSPAERSYEPAACQPLRSIMIDRTRRLSGVARLGRLSLSGDQPPPGTICQAVTRVENSGLVCSESTDLPVAINTSNSGPFCEALTLGDSSFTRAVCGRC